MRTRLQALLGSTALAGAIAVAALMSSGSVRYASADPVTDTVRDMMTALMTSQSAAIPEATRTAVGAALNSTTDGAALMAQLNGLALQNAALAETIGSALGKASLSLQLTNPSAANQINTFVASTPNSNIASGYSAAQRPITANGSLRASGVQVAQENLDIDLLNGLSNIQTFAGGNVSNFIGVQFVSSAFTRASGRQFTAVANMIANVFKVGPYSA